ncbi:MAG TPA: hypothetical protein VGF69_08175 [Thermoanaerobaculia bacterium]|jgi:hypothetical protein
MAHEETPVVDQMQPIEYFRKLYDLSIQEFQTRLPAIERFLGIDGPASVSIDDQRNRPYYYDGLAANNAPILDECLGRLLAELGTVPYEGAGEIFAGLDFLQSVAAQAMWRYCLGISRPMEDFTRDFDRLDVDEERRRLYELVRQDHDFGVPRG